MHTTAMVVISVYWNKTIKLEKKVAVLEKKIKKRNERLKVVVMFWTKNLSIRK